MLKFNKIGRLFEICLLSFTKIADVLCRFFVRMLSLEQILWGLKNAAERTFARKNRLRYSRERALQNSATFCQTFPNLDQIFLRTRATRTRGTSTGAKSKFTCAARSPTATITCTLKSVRRDIYNLLFSISLSLACLR